MVAVQGLIGLRPRPETAARLTTPPYDVIKEGSPLQKRLASNPDSLYHVILGTHPAEAFEGLRARGIVVPDEEPAFYVYEQRWNGGSRTGVYLALEVTEYAAGQVIRHEKTFDEKVKGRIALARATGHTVGPVFLLTRAKLEPVLEQAKKGEPVYDFVSDFGGGTDLHGVASRVWRVPAQSELGAQLASLLAPHPLYIADGHHRYHAALRNGQTHVLGYVTEEARILAYNRVVNGARPWAEAKSQLALERERFETPPKHVFALYARDGSYRVRALSVPDDVVGRLDCAILEREVYRHLGLTHDHIVDPAHFDYYPESALDEMKAAVDRGEYELAIALHPVSLDELIAVADAGLDDPNIVMPEKSTFFSPKVLSGLFLYRHAMR